VSAYQTDEEQVEAIKKWWKENGKSVIGGVALGLLVVGGGKGWMEYSRVQAENTSNSYESFSQTARGDDLEGAVQRADQLMADSGKSTYAAFAALEMAKLQYQAGDKAKARQRLQWVVDNATEQAIKQLAQLRLANLLLDMDLPDDAGTLAGAVSEGGFAGEFSALRGDIALVKGDKDTARQAWQQALNQGAADVTGLRMKLTSVGG
jgi:predicted negative regulator of RcsB-dependent stress response